MRLPRVPRSSAFVLAAVLVSLELGGSAWARPVEAPPGATAASYEGARPVASSTPPPAASVPPPAPRAAAAPAPAPSRGGGGSGHVARQASVSVVFVLLAIVTLFLV